MIGATIRQSLALHQFDVLGDQAVVDGDHRLDIEQRIGYLWPGGLESCTASGISKLGLSEHFLKVMRPGCAVEIAHEYCAGASVLHFVCINFKLVIADAKSTYRRNRHVGMASQYA